MEINHYRLSSPFNGEKSILCLDYNKEKIELPFIPQVFFPLEMAQLKEMASFPTAFFIADPSDIPRAHHAKTVKIKITHLDFENGMELIKKTLVSIKAKIRIDANRTLTPEQVQILRRCIPQDRLDFFEEPTQNIEDVLDLNVPLALDESFLEPGWEKN
jgi:O-succinylbenzoate synthase